MTSVYNVVSNVDTVPIANYSLVTEPEVRAKILSYLRHWLGNRKQKERVGWDWQTQGNGNNNLNGSGCCYTLPLIHVNGS